MSLVARFKHTCVLTVLLLLLYFSRLFSLELTTMNLTTTESLSDKYDDRIDRLNEADVIFAVSLWVFHVIFVLITCIYPCYTHYNQKDLYSMKKSNNDATDNNNKDQNDRNVLLHLFKELSLVWKQYLIIIIHYWDTTTDQILLLEWYYYDRWLDVEENGINYSSSMSIGIFLIVLYRVITGYYLYKYYNKQKSLFIAQLFDVGICVELHESHLRYDLTDNLKYISKLEQTYETTPFILLQLYVLLRILPQPIEVPSATYFSLVSSFLSLISKLIMDDASTFITKQGSRKVLVSRLIFRMAELIGRTLIATMIGAYFGLYFVFFWLIYEVVTNFVLYDKVELSKIKKTSTSKTTTTQTKRWKYNILARNISKKKD